MIPELGHVALIIAFCLAVALAVIPLWGAAKQDVSVMNMAPPLAVSVTLFVAIAFSLLTTSFLSDDFSVAVVAANSNSLLPRYSSFPRCGVITRALAPLVLILSGWMTAVAFFAAVCRSSWSLEYSA